MSTDLPNLETDRLLLRLGKVPDAPAVLQFWKENRVHLQPSRATIPESYFTSPFWLERFQRDQEEFRTDQSLRLFLFARADPERVLGFANFFGFARGAAQYCTLGYALGESAQGQGLMREALQAAIGYVFDVLNMHRVQANFMPTNTRSGELLKRLGFRVEGYAPEYLFLDGAWQDHFLSSLTNSRWRPR